MHAGELIRREPSNYLDRYNIIGESLMASLINGYSDSDTTMTVTLMAVRI